MRLLVDDKKLAENIISVMRANKKLYARDLRRLLELAIRESAAEVQKQIIHYLCKRCREGKDLTLDVQKEFAHLERPGGILHKCGAANIHGYVQTDVS